MFILMRIGCIECGNESEVVGTFDYKTDAALHAVRLNAEKWSNWMGEGQNHYEVFPLPGYHNAVMIKFADEETHRVWHNENREDWEEVL